MGLPLVEPEPVLPLVLRPIEQRLVDGHVGPAGTRKLINPQMPCHRCPAAPLSRGPALTHTPPPGGNCTPGSYLQRHCRSVPPSATPCAPALNARDMLPARAGMAGPTNRR